MFRLSQQNVCRGEVLVFGLLSTEQAVLMLKALRLPLHQHDETLSTLYPGGFSLLKTYVKKVTP